MADAIIDQDRLDELKTLANSDDRGRVYLEIYRDTGSRQALMESSISTFSETLGALANNANDLAATVNNPLEKFIGVELYPDPVDRFSRDITQGLLSDMQLKLNATGDAALTNEEMRQSAQNVWKDYGISNDFPGNLFVARDKLFEADFSGAIGNFASFGTAYSLTSGIWNYSGSALVRAATLEPTNADPIRPEDFKLSWDMGPRYQIEEIERNNEEVLFVTDQENNGRVVHVFDTGIGLLNFQDIGINGFLQGKAWSDLSSPDVPNGAIVRIPNNYKEDGDASFVQKIEENGRTSLKEIDDLSQFGLSPEDFPKDGSYYGIDENGEGQFRFQMPSEQGTIEKGEIALEADNKLAQLETLYESLGAEPSSRGFSADLKLEGTEEYMRAALPLSRMQDGEEIDLMDEQDMMQSFQDPAMGPHIVELLDQRYPNEMNELRIEAAEQIKQQQFQKEYERQQSMQPNAGSPLPNSLDPTQRMMNGPGMGMSPSDMGGM